MSRRAPDGLPVHWRGDRRLYLLIAILITVYAGLLRFEALIENYGWMGQPEWSEALAAYALPVARELRPERVVWGPTTNPYVGSDPVNYLRYAREMRHFYQGHVREPVFLALTRGFLWLTENRDIAVSFASAAGATLAVLATALLGWVARSPLVGLAAAFALATEFQAIAASIAGWRDETFTMTVALAAASFVLLHRRPTTPRAVLAGVAAAAACLTRITSISFVVPGLLWLVVESRPEDRRRALKSAALVSLVALALVAPYLINCWRATGDPLHAINYHARYYRSAEGLPLDESVGAFEYSFGKLTARPVMAVDTAAQGLFMQPFLNKWHGYGHWDPAITTVLRWCAAGGMIVALWSRRGRLLLVILLTSLLPYALTWSVGGGHEWRFTQHAYPFYLVFAFWLIADAGRLALAWCRREWSPWRAPVLVLARGAAVAAAALLAWLTYTAAPFLIIREALAAGVPANILAGDRDRWFFSGEWSEPIPGGNVTVRVAQSELTEIRVPLVKGSDYWMTLRVDPAETPDPAEQPSLAVFLNDRPLARLNLTRDPNRMGSYRLRVPDEIVRPLSHLDLLASRTVPAAEAGRAFSSLPARAPVAFRLWYVRLEPAGGAAVAK